MVENQQHCHKQFTTLYPTLEQVTSNNNIPLYIYTYILKILICTVIWFKIFQAIIWFPLNNYAT